MASPQLSPPESAAAPDKRRQFGPESRFPVLLLDRHQAAAVLGVSCRTFEELMDAAWMPRPVQLGPRLLRWSLEELEAAIKAMPRQDQKQESVRTRIARLKGQI